MLAGFGKSRAAEEHMMTLKALEHDIDLLKSDLKGLAKSFKGTTKDKYSDVTQWFKEATKDIEARAGGKLTDAYDAVRSGSKKAAAKTASGIGYRPFTSILAAFGVGLAIAVLVSRSHNK